MKISYLFFVLIFGINSLKSQVIIDNEFDFTQKDDNHWYMKNNNHQVGIAHYLKRLSNSEIKEEFSRLKETNKINWRKYRKKFKMNDFKIEYRYKFKNRFQEDQVHKVNFHIIRKENETYIVSVSPNLFAFNDLDYNLDSIIHKFDNKIEVIKKHKINIDPNEKIKFFDKNLKFDLPCSLLSWNYLSCDFSTLILTWFTFSSLEEMNSFLKRLIQSDNKNKIYLSQKNAIINIFKNEKTKTLNIKTKKIYKNNNNEVSEEMNSHYFHFLHNKYFILCRLQYRSYYNTIFFE